MIRVSINKAIGKYWGICEADIADQLKVAAPGEVIEILINSPGGEVYEGIAIFNLIREYAKTHSIINRVTGLAASMASYIMIAPRTVNKNSKIVIYENSICLIHNPWNIIMGDYREMQKAADYLERLAAMSGSTYAHVSGKPIKEIRDLMDDETYYVGNEIIENGFANEFEQINKDENNGYEYDKNNLMINAKLWIDRTIKEMRENVDVKADLEKAVALIDRTFLPPEAPGGLIKSFESGPGTPAGAAIHLANNNPGNEGVIMDKEELKKKYPDLYAAIYGEGKEAGVKEERERVEAHLKLGQDCGNMKIATQFISEGKTIMDNKVQGEYLSARMNNQALNNRLADDPPPINPANGESVDDAALESAWNRGVSGKNLQGAKA